MTLPNSTQRQQFTLCFFWIFSKFKVSRWWLDFQHLPGRTFHGMDKGWLCHPLRPPGPGSSHWLCCYAPVTRSEWKQFSWKLIPILAQSSKSQLCCSSWNKYYVVLCKTALWETHRLLLQLWHSASSESAPGKAIIWTTCCLYASWVTVTFLAITQGSELPKIHSKEPRPSFAPNCHCANINFDPVCWEVALQKG